MKTRVAQRGVRHGESHGLLVSIHDVTPALAAPVQALWELCQAYGVTPALLVVPQWHGDWPLEDAPVFMEWIRRCAEHGAEILLHGERHDEVGLPRDWRDHWRALGRTNGEGEFLTLDADAARTRIARGLSRLRALGLAPMGFVPPAWLAREYTHALVRDAGLAVSEDAHGVRVHGRGVRLAAPAVRWSGRSALRARASQLLAMARWHVHRAVPLVRLALHPQDLTHPVTAASVRAETARWARARTVMRYADLVDAEQQVADLERAGQ